MPIAVKRDFGGGIRSDRILTGGEGEYHPPFPLWRRLTCLAAGLRMMDISAI